MPGRIWTGNVEYGIIMESFNNPNITIAEICRNHGIAASMLYKWKEHFPWMEERAWKERPLIKH